MGVESEIQRKKVETVDSDDMNTHDVYFSLTSYIPAVIALKGYPTSHDLGRSGGQRTRQILIIRLFSYSIKRERWVRTSSTAADSRS